MLPDAIRQYSISALPIRKVTSVCTLCDVLNFGGTKQLLSHVHILLQLFLTIPVAAATSERTFSALRTTMGQQCLNHLLLLYCHKACTDAIDLSRIAPVLVSGNERQLQLCNSVKLL